MKTSKMITSKMITLNDNIKQIITLNDNINDNTLNVIIFKCRGY
jgi:hypothetical protein